MIALARSSDPPDSEGDADPSRWGDVRLSSLLAATADRYPSRLAFADQPNRENWGARPRIAWTYANTQRITERLATALAGLELAPGAPVGICLPNGSEACVAVLAVERAGYLPCLLPAGWSEDVLAQALEAASIVAIICQTRVAEEQPAEAFCRLAARYFGIRFVCAFGPQVPDGVIDLDRAILDTTPALTETNTGFLPGVVTFQLRDGRVIPLFRPTPSSLAAAVSFLVARKIDASDRILSLLAPDDLRGITTGLVASLITGATLESHGLVDGLSFEAACRGETRTHLVAPGWMEPVLAAAELPESIASVVLVHEAPVRFKARGDLRQPATDVLGFGEIALVSRARSDSGHLMLSVEEDGASDDGTRELLRIRRDEDGTLHFGGTAAETYDFARGGVILPVEAPQWRSSGFKADLFAGIVIGVR
jgi:mycobactin salicyl-AMP ligase